MPILSKICPTCGYVEEGKEDDNILSPNEVVTVLERILHAIKDIPQPSFAREMGHLSYITLPILAVFSLVMAVISEAGLFWILFLLFAVMAVVALVRKGRGTLGNAPFNRRLAEYKNDFQYFQRKAERDFGKSREVSSLVEEISGQISSIEAKRKSASSRYSAIWGVLILAIVALGAVVVLATDSLLNDPSTLPAAEQVEAYTAQGDWQKAAEAYKLMDPESGEAVSAREQIMDAVLTAGATTGAEEFFLSSCMGRIQDYDWAARIVAKYKAEGQNDAAAAFVDKCTSMRYPSDKNKLKNLL